MSSVFLSPPRSPASSDRSLDMTECSTAEGLISISRDVAAILSMTVETGASMLHDKYQRVLSQVGFQEALEHKMAVDSPLSGEAGRGLAVVITGAGDPIGDALAINFAKSGYTVFALMPQPGPTSPNVAAAVTQLLDTWRRRQRNLQLGNPTHPGAIIPLVNDSASGTPPSTPPHGSRDKGLYFRICETVRSHLHEHRLSLVAIICSPRIPRYEPQVEFPTPAPTPPRGRARVKFVERIESIPTSRYIYPQAPFADDQRAISTQLETRSPTHRPLQLSIDPPRQITGFKPVSAHLKHGSIVKIDQESLDALYQSNIVEPLTMVHELIDWLEVASEREMARSRLIFVKGNTGLGIGEVDDEARQWADTRLDAASKMLGYLREKRASMLKEDLVNYGIDVCEVLVGPMCRERPVQTHYRTPSDESSSSSSSSSVISSVTRSEPGSSFAVAPRDTSLTLARKIHAISRLWAVDDDLLFASVRQAIEDRYPRSRYHAGISPLVATFVDMVPGSGVAKWIGRWVLKRLFTPR